MSGFHMIVSTIVESCDPIMFGLLQKDEPEFMPTHSCVVNLKLSGYRPVFDVVTT